MVGERCESSAVSSVVGDDCKDVTVSFLNIYSSGAVVVGCDWIQVLQDDSLLGYCIYCLT